MKRAWTILKNFMIIFSFFVSVILVVVLLAVVLLIFDIKRNIAQPVVAGLHSSFVGLDEATIDWTIPVRDTIPVQLTVPLETDTVVVLTESVPLVVAANITLPGVGQLNNASVALSLPAGLRLPVRLDLDVPIDEQLDIALDVRAVIPINQTQLHDPIENLRLTFEPIIRALYNLPNDWGAAFAWLGDVLNGTAPSLLAENDYSRDPWAGYSRTAGVGYTLGTEPVPLLNQAQPTGLVPAGGIPALDEQLRPEIYAQGGPAAVNARAAARLQGLLLPEYYDGSYGTTHPAPIAPELVPPDNPIVEPLTETAGG